MINLSFYRIDDNPLSKSIPQHFTSSKILLCSKSELPYMCRNISLERITVIRLVFQLTCGKVQMLLFHLYLNDICISTCISNFVLSVTFVFIWICYNNIAYYNICFGTACQQLWTIRFQRCLSLFLHDHWYHPFCL